MPYAQAHQHVEVGFLGVEAPHLRQGVAGNEPEVAAAFLESHLRVRKRADLAGVAHHFVAVNAQDLREDSRLVGDTCAKRDTDLPVSHAMRVVHGLFGSAELLGESSRSGFGSRFHELVGFRVGFVVAAERGYLIVAHRFRFAERGIAAVVVRASKRFAVHAAWTFGFHVGGFFVRSAAGRHVRLLDSVPQPVPWVWIVSASSIGLVGALVSSRQRKGGLHRLDAASDALDLPCAFSTVSWHNSPDVR